MVVEFGCYDSLYSTIRFGSEGAGVPDSKRLEFIKDMREAWEAYGIGWCYWSYNEGFTVFTTEYHVDHVGDSPTAEEAARYADYALLTDSLGLTPNMGYGSDAFSSGAGGAWELRGDTDSATENQVPASPDVQLSGGNVTSEGVVFDGNGFGVVQNIALNVDSEMTISAWVKTGSDGTILSAGQEWLTGTNGKWYVQDFDGWHQIWGTDIRPYTESPAQGTACLLGRTSEAGDIVFAFQPDVRDMSSYLSGDNGVVHLSIYVSDPSKIVGGQLELTGTEGLLAWTIPVGQLSKGWNDVTFPISGAISRNTDVSDLRGCRIYFNATDKVVVMVDDMYLTYDHRDAGLEQWNLAVRNGALTFTAQGQTMTGGQIADQNWHHVVLQVQGETVTMYVDGESAGQATLDGLDVKTAVTNLVIAADTAGENGFNGTIRDVAVYNQLVQPDATWQTEE